MNQTSLVGRPLAAITAALVGFAEKRGVWSGPLTSSSPELARLWASPATSTGVSVSESSALTYSTVWACVNNISTDVASLPLILYKNLPNGGKQRLTTHKLYRLLHDEPNPEMSSMTFRGMVQAHALTWGNGYSEIVRDGAGAPAALWPITPDRVTVRRDVRTYRLYYEVSRLDGGMDRIAAEDMLHIQGLGYDGTVGYNLIAQAREAIALALATERFGGTFFGNGQTFGGVISLKEQLTEPAKKSFREQMEAQHQGVDRAHKFLLLGNEAKYERLGIPPNDAQFIETRLNQVEEICRYFRMPPHKVQHLLRSTNNNIEHQGIEYYSDTLRPWCVRWEQEIKRKLIAPSERMIQTAEHKIEGVLRGDLASRYQAYAVGRQWGWLSANRICELENMDPLPKGGDVFLVPMNMSPADRINEIVDKQVAPNPKPVAPAAPKDNDDDRTAKTVEAIREALKAAETRMAEHATHAADVLAQFTAAHVSTEERDAQIADAQQRAHEAQVDVAKLQALLLLANERADREAAEKDATRAAVEAAEAHLREADVRMAETAQAHVDAHARAEALQVDRDRLLVTVADATLRAEQFAIDHATALAELQTATSTERAASEAVVANLSALRAVAEQQRDERGAVLGQLEIDLAEAKARVVTVTAELETLRAEAATATAQAAQLARDRETIEAEARAAQTQAERTLAATTTQLTAAQAEALALQAERDRLQAVRAEAERAAEQTTIAADEALAQSTARLTAAEQLAADRAAQVATEQAARAELEKQLADTKAYLDTLTAKLETSEAAEAAANAAAVEAQTQRSAADQRVADHVTRLTAEETSRAAAEATVLQMRKAFADRKQAQIPANRDLILDALAAPIWKETDRARKNKLTPAKCKAWAEAFYPQHEDTLVDSLRAVMRTHLVFIGSTDDVDTYTRALIHPHLEAALAQIRTLAAGDADDFPVAIERVLTKWEQERPAAIADRVVQEEITYVRSL
jgi:HK97 family phage portal protein